MTYDPNAPDKTKSPRATVDSIITNFQQLNTIFSNDHEAFTISTGKHKKIEFNNNNTAGTQTGTQSAIYTSGTPPQVKFKNSAVDYFMTGNFTNGTKGHCFLPGGFLLQWDRITGVGNSTPATFSTPFGVIPYAITLNIEGTPNTKTVGYDNKSTTGFNIKTNGTGLTINYMAIGQAP